MYIRHELKEYYIRNDANSVSLFSFTIYLSQLMKKNDNNHDELFSIHCSDPEMIHINSSPEAPPPRIRILDTRSREVETVRIGDRLTFRIEIPEDSKFVISLWRDRQESHISYFFEFVFAAPYGIFARSCVAMAKDSKSTFQIIDDEGCPVDPTIFPAFTPDGNALQSVYEAFRFTESYGVIFQCNVKYCLGPCEPAVCEWGRDSVESWGRKRRSVAA